LYADSDDLFILFLKNYSLYNKMSNVKNIHVLEGSDLTPQGALVSLDAPRKVIAMAQANWCGHCTRMKPDFQKAADMLTSDDVAFATIDCSGKGTSPGENKAAEIATKVLGVQGFPTILVFENGQPGKMVELENRSVEGIKKLLM
jgi:thiol-disulfide isomerase/thioredoxin